MEPQHRNGDALPFTVQELENHNTDWSLSCDIRLLSNLKQLSELMFTRAEQVTSAIDAVQHKAQERAVQVSNVVNELQMLATSQFIENRVYDEGEEAPTAQPVTEEPEPTNMLSTIKSSLCQGLAFVRHTMPELRVDDDSDEEENIRSSIQISLRQNRFLSGQLPPLIGGPDFDRQSFVTLLQDHSSLQNEDGDAVDAVEAEDDSKGSDSESDIAISSSDSEDMFLPHPNHISSASANVRAAKAEPLFSDFSSPEPEDLVTDPTSSPLPKTTSFRHELSRRLQGHQSQPNPTLADPLRSHASAPESSHGLRLGTNDAAVCTMDVPALRPGHQTRISSGTDAPDVQGDKDSGFPVAGSRSITLSAAVTGSAPVTASKAALVVETPATRSVLDFLSDDDDDFNIFTRKVPAKEKATRKVSKLWESDDDEDEAGIVRRKGLSAKDSGDSRCVPEKEVSDVHCNSETGAAQQSASAASQSLIPRNSILSATEQSSDDELFASPVVQIPSHQQTSINSSSKSQVQQLKILPVLLTDRRAKESISSDDSESSAGEMNRSAIASKLEDSIFGNKSRKPVGGISLFANSQQQKSTPDPSAERTAAIVLPASDSIPVTANQPSITNRLADHDLFSLEKSSTLSSQAIKSRPKVPNKRRPTRAAFRTPLSADVSPADGEVLTVAERLSSHVESTSATKSTSGATDAEDKEPETLKSASVKSDANEIRRTGKEKTQIPSLSPHQSQGGNLITAPHTLRQKDNSDSNARTLVSTILFSDDSDDDFAAAIRRKGSSDGAPDTSAQPTAVSVQSQPKKGIFSDSEDDDIFFSAKKASAPTPISSVPRDKESVDSENKPLSGARVQPPNEKAATSVKSTHTKSAVAAKTKEEVVSSQKSIFSDDSDDDDLFRPKH